jgi:uncharacterized membrane protein
VSVTPITADWREERLYVLNMIEDLKAEQRRISEEAAVARVNVAQKLKKDVHEAHEKIRALEGSKTELRLKIWLMTLVLSASGAVAFELVKALLHGWKP